MNGSALLEVANGSFLVEPFSKCKGCDRAVNPYYNSFKAQFSGQSYCFGSCVKLKFQRASGFMTAAFPQIFRSSRQPGRS